MVYRTRILCLVLAAWMLLAALTGCTIGGEDYDPLPEVRYPAQTPVPNASGELTFGGQTFSVDAEQLVLLVFHAKAQRADLPSCAADRYDIYRLITHHAAHLLYLNTL